MRFESVPGQQAQVYGAAWPARTKPVAKQLTYPEILELLPGAEAEDRRERCLSTSTRMAHFPFQRTPEQYDFAFRPSIDERQVK